MRYGCRVFYEVKCIEATTTNEYSQIAPCIPYSPKVYLHVIYNGAGLMANGIKIITTNKKAFHDFFVNDRIEGGLVLTGPEVKSLREGHCSLVDSYARFVHGELFLVGMNVPPYKNLGYAKHDPHRNKKVLLHKEELKKLFRQVMEKGVTLIPVKLYFKEGKAKIEIAIASGKKQYDKREDIQKRDQKREEGRLRKKYKIR